MKCNSALIAVLASALLTWLEGFAVIEFPFEVKAPEWKAFASCTVNSGINIRQLPSAESPRAMVNHRKITDMGIPLILYANWSAAKPGGQLESLKFREQAPVIDERDGWLKLYGIGPKMADGWVPARYCRLMSAAQCLKPIKDLLQNGYNYREINGGDYGIYMEADLEMYQGVDIYIGKFVGDYFVCPYYLYASLEISSQKNGLTRGAGSSWILSVTKPCDSEDFSFNDIPEDMIMKIIQNAGKLETPTVFYNFKGSLMQEDKPLFYGMMKSIAIR